MEQSITDFEKYFDSEYYASIYPDLQTAIIGYTDANKHSFLLGHYLHYGVAENRRYRLKNKNTYNEKQTANQKSFAVTPQSILSAPQRMPEKTFSVTPQSIPVTSPSILSVHNNSFESDRVIDFDYVVEYNQQKCKNKNSNSRTHGGTNASTKTRSHSNTNVNVNANENTNANANTNISVNISAHKNNLSVNETVSPNKPLTEKCCNCKCHTKIIHKDSNTNAKQRDIKKIDIEIPDFMSSDEDYTP